MKSSRLVSIIMTCYNGKHFLKEAIQSILDQTYQNWELIFYDNCSNDGSMQLVSQYQDPRIRCFHSEQLVNLGTIRKLSLQKCQGYFVSFLDVDDYWSKLKLQKQIEKFEEDSNLDVVYSNYSEVREEKVIKKKKFLFNGYCQKEIILSYVNGSPLTAWLTLMIKKSSIDKLKNSFDANLHISSDFDLILRLSNFCKFDYVEDFLAFYRLHDFNESKNNIKEIEELAYILLKYKNDNKISLPLKEQNFGDKIMIKNFLYQRISSQFCNSNIHFNNIFYKCIYFFIKITPKQVLRIFCK